MAQTNSPRLAIPVSDRDHVQGPLTAPVLLVEYADFECPYCRAAVVIVQDLQRGLGNQLGFVYRHFPLTNVHPHAWRASEAAEAAAAQGRFWEMHASLFRHQDALDDGHLARYAADLGLDVARFQQDLAERRYSGRVREDFQGGIDSGVDGTPTFYLDGVRHDGPIGLRQFLQAVRTAHPETEAQALEQAEGQRVPRVVWDRSPFRRPG